MTTGAIRKAKEEAKVVHHPVKVVIRCRPFSEKEISIHGKEAGILLDEELGTVDVLDPKNKTVHRTYAFDGVYGPNRTQEDVYIGCCKAVTDSILDGFNGSIIAYGQTGTGKTYTMEGDLKNTEQQGMMCRVVQHIFSRINMDTSRNYQVNLSYIEIYQDTLRDLLNISGKKLKMHEVENGIYIDGLSNVTCRDFQDVLTWYHNGKVNRRTRSTNMSISSSRSHTILRLTVTSFDEKKEVKTGILNLVDLAGSESQRKAGTKGEALKEASKMNNSLSTLGKVVSMISSGNHRHIPYRECKLTRVLQESLGGNCFTTILATIGPCVSDFEETLNTLRFSAHARNLKKIVKANFSPRCGEGALIKDKIRSLSQEEFKAVQVQELREKLRLIRHGLTVNPNDHALQDMENSCKNKINQILWMHEEINEVLGIKGHHNTKKDPIADKEVIKDEAHKLQRNKNVTRELLVSIEHFQQEVTSVVSCLKKQIDEIKHLSYEEDLKEHARISFSESNIFPSRRPTSRIEALRPTKSETSTGLQDIADCRRREIFFDHFSQKDKLFKPDVRPSHENLQTLADLSNLSSEKIPKLMMNKSTQIFKGDLKNKFPSGLKSLNFKIDFYQLVLKFLLEAKEMLVETNELLKKMNNKSEISSINDDFSNDGDKSTSNSTSTCSLNK